MPSSDWTEGRYLRQRRNLNAMSIALLTARGQVLLFAAKGKT